MESQNTTFLGTRPIFVDIDDDRVPEVALAASDLVWVMRAADGVVVGVVAPDENEAPFVGVTQAEIDGKQGPELIVVDHSGGVHMYNIE